MLVTGCGLKDKLKTHCEIFMDTLFFYYSESKMGSGVRANYKNALLPFIQRENFNPREFLAIGRILSGRLVVCMSWWG